MEVGVLEFTRIRMFAIRQLPHQQQSLANAPTKLLGIASYFVYLCSAFFLNRNICLTQVFY